MEYDKNIAKGLFKWGGVRSYGSDNALKVAKVKCLFETGLQ